MTIQLNEKDRDELVFLLAEHKRMAGALAKIGDPKWKTSVALTTDEDVDRGEESYIEFFFSSDVIKDILIARHNNIVESLRRQGIVVQAATKS